MIRPLSPVFVEGIRSHLLASSRVGDATLFSLLAYEGLRPGEALALRWRDISNRTILVEKALSLGVVKDTKTRASRSVRLLSPLAADLREWRLASGLSGEDALLFPAHDGREFSEDDWRNWRRRVFLPAAAVIGLTGAKLRHSFVSLLIAEGTKVIEVARQAGHSPTMTLEMYGHVFEESTGAEHGSAEEAIWAARVPAAYPTLEAVEET